MAYNLPRAWDAGFALPSNVRDEGLQRRAFVTKQMPRGTYDQPKVGAAGYAVPQYVRDEGYGQGVFVTDWQPSGTYSGPRVPHFQNARPRAVAVRKLPGGGQQVTVARPALGGDQLPEPYESYGQRAASELMSRVAHLPQQRRKTELKRVLDAIDPSLWKRTAEITRRNVAAGHPPAVALHQGLARAMGSGLVAEVIHTGNTRAAPAARSLLGLGCYGCAAVMGALGDVAVPGAKTMKSAATMDLLAASATGPTDGQCTPDGQFRFAGGAWTRLKAGQACTSTYTGAKMTVEVHEAGSGVGSGKRIETQAAVAAAMSKMIQVGPFSIPADAKKFAIHWSGKLPPEWASFITKELAEDCHNCILSSMRASGANTIYGRLADFLGGVPSQINHDFVGIKLYKAGQDVIDETPDQPIAVTKRPDNGETWGLYLTITQRDMKKPWHHTDNPTVLQFDWYEVDKGVWDWIKIIASTLVDWYGDYLDFIGDMACKIISSPQGAAGAAAAGAAYGGGGGAQAGAQGAEIAKSICAGAPPVCPAGQLYDVTTKTCMAVTAKSSDLLPLAIIGGVGLAAVLLLTGKKKAKAAPP